MARRKIVAGNWKMNMTPSEAVKLVDGKTMLKCLGNLLIEKCIVLLEVITALRMSDNDVLETGR